MDKQMRRVSAGNDGGDDNIRYLPHASPIDSGYVWFGVRKSPIGEEVEEEPPSSSLL